MTAKWQIASFRLRGPQVAILLPCALLVGCASPGWHGVNPHYDSAVAPLGYSFDKVASKTKGRTIVVFSSIFATSDGSQVWAVGTGGTILHYTARTGQWAEQPSGTTSDLSSIFGTSDGAQVWTVGNQGTILHYTAQADQWEKQDSGTTHDLTSVFATSDGAHVWAAGLEGTTVQYVDGHWEAQRRGTGPFLRSIFSTQDGTQVWAVGDHGIVVYYRAGSWKRSHLTDADLNSVFGTSDGSQLWAVGEKGTILHCTTLDESCEVQGRGMANDDLYSIFGSTDGSQLWVAAGGTILHYTSGHWEADYGAGIRSIFVTNDTAHLWAVSDSGDIMRGEPSEAWPYIRDVRLLPTVKGAELQIRLIDRRPNTLNNPKIELTLEGLRKHSFELGFPLQEVPTISEEPSSADPALRLLTFNPADIDVGQGMETHLRIWLSKGYYRTYYDVDLTFDRFHLFREHRSATLVAGSVATLITGLALLLLIRLLWILYVYRKLKIYTFVEQIEVPGISGLLYFLLKFTVLPWFVTHPRMLRAWVQANRKEAAAAWSISVRTQQTVEPESLNVNVPYVSLPIEMRHNIDVHSTAQLLNQPTAEDFESLFDGGRSVVQIVGPGGGGKTTLAKHIGDLGMAGREVGGFKDCRLPIWVDEDFPNLRAVVRRKINTWHEEGEEIEDLLLNALLEKGFLLIVIDRVSERSAATRDYLSKVHGSVRCNALLITTRQAIPMEIPEQRFIYPKALDSSTLLHFMTLIIKYYLHGSTDTETEPFSTLESQLELGKRVAALITIRIGNSNSQEVPMLPLPVVLFVSDAMALVNRGKNLDELPNSLPDVYASYLRQINPKGPETQNRMSDEEMFAAAKVLATLAIGTDYTPKEFREELARQCLKTEVSNLPPEIDPLRRLVDNSVLLSKAIGATRFFRFMLDPVAEFLAAEAYFDKCGGEEHCLERLVQESKPAQGFQNALLLTIQARRIASAIWVRNQASQAS